MRSFILGSVLAVVLAQHAGAAPPLVVEALYPSANPREVETAVALPLEQSLRGLDGVGRVSTVCIDGRCVLRLEPDGTVGRPFLRVEVINRLQQARRTLPDACKQKGVVLLPDVDEGFEVVSVWSDGKDDLARVRKYAAEQVEPQLASVPGVARVTVIGAGSPQVRFWLDPDKLAACKLTAADVQAAVRDQNLTPRATKVEDLESLVVQRTKDGVILLRDVGKVEMSNEGEGVAGVLAGADPCAAVLLLVHPSAGKADAVGKSLKTTLARLQRTLPSGVSVRRWTFPARGTTITLRLPDGSSVPRKDEVARVTAGQLRKLKGAAEVVWFARPGDAEAVVLAFPAKEGTDPLAAAVARVAEEVPVARVRLRKGYDPVAPWPGHGSDLVVEVTRDDPDRRGSNTELLEAARRLSGDLARVKGVANLTEEADGQEPRLSIDISRSNMQQCGVRLEDVMAALQVHGVGAYVNDFNRFGRTWQVGVRTRFRNLGPDEIGRLYVKSRDGVMVPLDRFVRVRTVEAESFLYRVDGRRCVVVSCNVRGAARRDVVAAIRKMAGTLPEGISARVKD